MKVMLNISYTLDGIGGPRGKAVSYPDAGGVARVPVVGDKLRFEGRLFVVHGVTWDLDAPALRQEVHVRAHEVSS
ncbi:hypothetical protein SEA_ENNEA_65 [Gordonia phage Ennea]|nr:hypothetical protein SEA_ENNEA_65 [Gordonia phage Ennea]